MSGVERAIMVHRWEHLSFIHWPIEARDVAPLLPPEIEPDTFDGAAWVGVIPFRCRIRLPGTPFMPWISSFDEVNVRTYVRGSEGPGIWFFSLDAARLAAVLVARAMYRIPYVWSRMRTDRKSVV